jgi:small GTP-binding protein
MTARKIMLLGEIGVGKSSIAKRLVLDRFEFDYKPTVGVDVYVYEVPDSPTRPGMKLIVWDTDGNFGDAIFRHVYMKQAQAAMVVGDVTRQATLEAMASLGDGFREAFPGRPVSFLLNKQDLVAAGAGPELPAALTRPGVSLVRTSALTGDNVREAFRDAADIIHRRAS